MLADRYLGIIDALERASVRYVVAGGIAVNLHGFARFTKDLDLLLDLEPQNALRGMQALAGCGLRPRVPVALEDFADPAKREDWATNRNMLVFQVWDPGDPFCTVDVFVRNPIEFDGLWARAVVERIGDVTCRVASIDDLIVLKRMAGRPQELSDIQSLEQIQRLREYPP
jgi:hypothetical protein